MPQFQPDLFADHELAREEFAVPAFEKPPADFVARIRDELEATLRTVRAAETLGGPDARDAGRASLPFDRQMASQKRGSSTARGVRGRNDAALPAGGQPDPVGMIALQQLSAATSVAPSTCHQCAIFVLPCAIDQPADIAGFAFWGMTAPDAPLRPVSQGFCGD
jgi:hypothetical protein